MVAKITAAPAYGRSADAPFRRAAPEKCVNARCYKTYAGAFFDIAYPRQFTPRIIEKSRTSDYGADCVVFLSPDGDAEFYIYSPQWGGVAPGLELDAEKEILVSKKSIDAEGTPTDIGAAGAYVWVTIAAKDKTYTRFYQEFTNNSVHWAIGAKFKNMESQNKYREEYIYFKKSLKQYADN